MPEISADLRSAPSAGSPFWRLAAADFGLTGRDRDVLRRTFHDATEPDRWLPNGATYRRRAYQLFDLSVADLVLRPVPEPPPYVQSKAVNTLVGGVERRFRVIAPDHPATAPAGRIAATVARGLTAAGVLSAREVPHCLVDAHYMSISAPGSPAPEGKHRDGLIAGSAHLIERRNIKRGTGISAIYDGAEPDRVLSRFELREPLDSYVFDDERVLHHTTDIDASEPGEPAYRNVLLIGFRRHE
ncbi:2OG-Fe dioxygenase family protein [Nocardia puris]|uniref:2OG-Fe dioxygenase family protein n=1 Tax=Nocardia puris TaxID=208602 RepID=UPI001892D687|nr:2OG-Fe dioxygenase family protein [Nocardia puris]MBF6365015.1 2OG-Fe dioxygenase family protein [Nocardia puris]MBF6458800.1 2OG-Fe dioxygenase family protein [Nocardia puris]